MTHLYRITLLLPFLLLLAIYSPASQAEKVRAANCFQGHFSSYENWMNLLREMNKDDSAEEIEEFIHIIQQQFTKADFIKYQENLACFFIWYEVDNQLINGFIVYPKNSEKNRTIVFNRGGNSSYGSMNFFQLFKSVFDLSDRGFTVIGSQYRGANSPMNSSIDEFGGRDVQDVLALQDLFPKFPSIDPERVGMMGFSRGGLQSMVTLKEGFETPAVALLAGDYDLKKSLGDRPEMENVYRALIPNYEEESDKALTDRSAIYFADQLEKNTAFLIVHGKQDDKVNYHRSVELHAKLQDLDFDSELLLFDEGHGLMQNRQEILDKVTAFFERELGE